MSIWRKKPHVPPLGSGGLLMSQGTYTETRSIYPIHVLPLHPPPKTHPALAWHKSLLSAHPFSQSSPSHPPSLMSFCVTLFSYQMLKLMREISSTLQEIQDGNEAGKKSATLIFYHHPQNKKKNENQLIMADKEILEDSSSCDHNTPRKPLSPPGGQDVDQSAAAPGKDLTE